MFRPRTSLLVSTVLLAIAGPVLAQDPDRPRDCGTDLISISTGYAANAVLPSGAGDPNWTVTSDPDPATGEPRPAFVIAPNPGWKAPLANSTWISSYKGSANTTNGKYVFQYCFCLDADFERPVLAVSLRADDQADVFLNGTPIGSTPDPSFNTVAPTTIVPPSDNLFVRGRNCLTVELNNTNSIASGFNLAGSVAASGLAVQKPECCNPTGQIQGKKWDDANGNGVQDANEIPLSGWTIALSNGMTAVTDVHGFYNFFGVLPGSHTIAETQQSGWHQTFPAGGIHQVSVMSNQVLVGKDFGNRRESDDIPLCSLCGEISGACCLGLDSKGRRIYSFLIPVTYQSFSQSPGACHLKMAVPSGTVLSFSPTTLSPGLNHISGTFTVSGAASSPFCLKMTCGTGGSESCFAPVCLKELPPCGERQ